MQEREKKGIKKNKNHIREWFIIKLMLKKKKLKKGDKKKEKENVKDVIDYQDR